MDIDLQIVLEDAARKLDELPKTDEGTVNSKINTQLNDLSLLYDDDEEYYSEDITEMFHECCVNGLELGEIVNRNNFGLIDAMSAIELMDPKMDAGMLINSRRDPFPLNCENLKMENFSIEEQIGIIDETLACFTTWLDGQSMMQTLLTNAYLSDPKVITDKVMKAVSSSFIVIMNTVQCIVQEADVFVEEDFQPFNGCRSNGSLQSFPNTVECEELRAPSLIKEVEDELLRNVKFDVEKFVKFTTVIKKQLSIVIKTTHFGLQTEDCDRVDKNGKKLMMGFDPSLSQKFMPPTYPRYIAILPRQEALDYLDRCFTKMLTAKDVFDLSLPDALRIFVYSKVNNQTSGFITDVKESLRQFIAPPSLQRVPGSDKCALFLPNDLENLLDSQWNTMTSYYINCFKIAGHHSSRQRNKWGLLLTSLDVLQNEANFIDTAIHKHISSPEYGHQNSGPVYLDHLACYGTWVLHQSLLVMVRFTLAGFQLRLYSAYEYKYVYWYLYNCIYGWLKSTLIRAEEFSNAQDNIIDTWNKQRRKMRKKKKVSPNSKELLLCQALQNLCDAFFRAVTGFTIANKIKYPKFDFDCEEVRFKHRFLPFAALNSFPIIKYDQFKNNTDISELDPPLTEFDLYASSLKAFNQVRTLLESITPNPKIDILVKICKKNAIVMKLMSEGLQATPTFDFDEHSTFPVIKIM